MKTSEKALFAFFIWCAVYPAVLLATWLLQSLDLDLPLAVRVFLTTMFTVPLIEFVVLRRAKKVAAHVESELGMEGELKKEMTEDE